MEGSETRVDKTRMYRSAARAAWLGLVINLALGVVKLVGGLLGNSFALISDAANSLGDCFTSIVVLSALYVAQRPADAEHPYGHTRIEAIAGSNVAVLIIGSALLIGWEAIERFWLAHSTPPVWTLWIAGGNVIIKECLYRYKISIGKATGSTAILAGAWDHRSDALCSLAVLAGLGLVRLGGKPFMWADEAASLIVVAAIIWTGIRLLRQSTHELMDVQADPELIEQIHETALSVDGVLDVETLWVRKSGLEYFADIHIEVDPQATVEQGHRIGHQAKDLLIERFPMLRDVLVHLEPHTE